MNANKPKSPLDPEALRDVIDLSLWAGQLLLQHGAESARIEETVHRLGTGLGADWMDVLVSPNAIAVTTSSGQEFRTKIRRVVAININMSIIDAVNTVSRKVSSDEIDRFRVRKEFEQIDRMPPQYSRWTVVIMVGFACAAFSRLFGGDWAVFGVTLAASSVAMWVRQQLNHHHFNSLLIVIVTAFIAGSIASITSVFKLSPEPQISLVASVLLLVPGVQLINSAEDLIQGHLVTGIVRGLTGGLVALGIAVGLAIAMRLMGISGL